MDNAEQKNACVMMGLLVLNATKEVAQMNAVSKENAMRKLAHANVILDSQMKIVRVN